VTVVPEPRLRGLCPRFLSCARGISGAGSAQHALRVLSLLVGNNAPAPATTAPPSHSSAPWSPEIFSHAATVGAGVCIPYPWEG